MTDPTVQRLWPEPEQMHTYIDRWRSYIEELENRYQVEAAGHAVTRSTLTSEATQLKAKLDVVDAPYQEQIRNLEAQIAAQAIRVGHLEKDNNDAVQRLALMLETSPSVKGVTLQGLISQAILFIEETKRQFRSTL